MNSFANSRPLFAKTLAACTTNQEQRALLILLHSYARTHARHFALSPQLVGWRRQAVARLVWPRRLGITVDALKDEEEEQEEERWARSQEASRASSSHWERWPLQGHLHRRPGHRFWKVGRGAGVEEEGADDKGEGPSWSGSMRKCLHSFKRPPP